MQHALRPYQSFALNELRAGIRAGNGRQLLMLATGGGKTTIASAIMQGVAAKGKRACFIVDSSELVDQTVSRFVNDGLDVGVIQADHLMTDYGAQIQVATIQTLRNRWDQLKQHDKLLFDLFIIDECHVLHKAHERIIDEAGVPVVGLSATPFRKGLGKVFNRMVVGATVADLTDEGFLAPATIYVPHIPQMKGVKTNNNGDWQDDAVAAVMDEKGLIADICNTWLNMGEDRQTLVFAANVAHSQHIVHQFKKLGINAEHIDGYMEFQDRDRIIRDYRAGKVKILSNVAVLTKGFDAPETSCLILARPTKSLMLHYQILGRGLRTAGGKDDCIVLDHAGNCIRNGVPTDPLSTELDKGDMENPDRKKREAKAKEPKSCTKCSFLKPAGVHKCPKCGFEPVAMQDIVEHDGELIALDGRKEKKEKFTPQDKARFYSELLGYAMQKGYNAGWAYHKCKARCGSAPRSTRQIGPTPPSQQTLGWIKHMQIREAKRREAA